MRLINARTGQPVASTVEMASTRATRRRGLLGRDSLTAGTALVLTPCNAVHSIGMRFTIDVAFVNTKGIVRKIVHRMAPWRMAVSPLSRTTIEFPAGDLDLDVLRVGDRLYLDPDGAFGADGVSASSAVGAFVPRRTAAVAKPLGGRLSQRAS